MRQNEFSEKNQGVSSSLLEAHPTAFLASGYETSPNAAEEGSHLP